MIRNSYTHQNFSVVARLMSQALAEPGDASKHAEYTVFQKLLESVTNKSLKELQTTANVGFV